MNERMTEWTDEWMDGWRIKSVNASLFSLLI